MIGGFGKEANFRLFLPLLLPNVSKVLYLDCDILCLGDISTLYNIDVSNSPYAACSENKYILQVNNPFCYSVHQAFYFFAKYLNISPLQEGFNYANSGVMLINNDYWRQYNYTQRSLDFFVEYKDNKSFVFPDQDIINYLAMQDKNCFVDLAWKYNLLQCHMDNCIVDKVLDTSSERFKIILDVLDNSIVEDGKIKPVIMHYAGENKPWKCGEKCLFYQEYISVAVAIGFVFWKNNNISKLQKNRRMTAKKLIKYMLPYGLVRLSQKNNL
jgi:lipopolysaccharide biosynthesis glycosyltransferase